MDASATVAVREHWEVRSAGHTSWIHLVTQCCFPFVHSSGVETVEKIDISSAVCEPILKASQ